MTRRQDSQLLELKVFCFQQLAAGSCEWQGKESGQRSFAGDGGEEHVAHEVRQREAGLKVGTDKGWKWPGWEKNSAGEAWKMVP